MKDVKNILENLAPVSMRFCPEWNPDAEKYPGVRAICYDGLDYKGQKTLIYAYVGLPEGASASSPVPGVVLIHGGTGHPYPDWIKMWTDRGYAAIAMETTGFVPSGDPADPTWTREADLPDGYTFAPDNDGMCNHTAPLDEQWMTHALAEVQYSNDILRSLPEVDENKIGVCGISWGGNITALAMVHDSRYAFAIPIYGAGYLDRSLSYMGVKWRLEGNIKNFRAEEGFADLKMPVLWLAWNYDGHFSLHIHTASYEATSHTSDQTTLCWIHEMSHGHVEGWTPDIQYLFADAIVGGGDALAHVVRQPEGKGAAFITVPEGTKFIGAKTYSINAPMTYGEVKDPPHPCKMQQKFVILDTKAEINGSSLEVTPNLPDDACRYYLEVAFENANGSKYHICSQWISC